MHCKPPKVKTMASLSGGSGSGTVGGDDDADGDSSRTGVSATIGHSPKSYSSNNNIDNNSNNINSDDPAQVKLKKHTLEQRKQELEKLLSEKSWLLQQIQKQETQILNGNYEYLNLNEIFGQLQQYKQDASSAVLRRKTAAKENQLNNNNNNSNSNNNTSNNNNRQSEISNRSSEYDNYPGEQMATSQPPVSTAHKVAATKKRQTSQNWNAAAVNTLSPQSTQQQQTQQQLRQQYIAQMTEQQHFQYTQQQLLQHQQQHQHRQLLPHQHYHPRPQIVTAYQSPTLPQTDAISLYSANSANVATLRQHPQHQQLQTPIVVQCDKYYLSPTHQSYNDGGFIKSSQNIKQYISPMSSPTIQQHLQPLKPLQLQQQRNFDVISLSPSYAAIIDPPASNSSEGQNLRWRSQSNIQYAASSPTSSVALPPEMKTYSADMLTQLYPNSPPHTLSTTNFYSQHSLPATAAAAAAGIMKSTKPLDDISIASFSSETQKKQKPKQWLESSLDGPIIRSNINDIQATTPTPTLPSPSQLPPARPPSTTHHHKPHTGALHHMQRERPRLSSQSMCSAQRYNSIAAQRGKASRLLQDDDGKYAKLSQSTSYLNSLETISVTTYFPEPLPLSTAAAVAPSPLPPRNLIHRAVPPLPATVAVDKPALSPEIRIESPKNMTIVQQATFQPYKEITKPFEMADFYKYSTKFRQKEAPTPSATNAVETVDNT